MYLRKNLRSSAEQICENLRETHQFFKPVQSTGEISRRFAQILTQILTQICADLRRLEDVDSGTRREP